MKICVRSEIVKEDNARRIRTKELHIHGWMNAMFGMPVYRNVKYRIYRVPLGTPREFLAVLTPIVELWAYINFPQYSVAFP